MKMIGRNVVVKRDANKCVMRKSDVDVKALLLGKSGRILSKKEDGTGAVGYVFLFLIMLVMVIATLYLAQVAKLMTHQHHVDDSLTDAVLASLVADDIYYFETCERGNTVVRFKDKDDSYDIFVDCMNDAVADTDDFYYNFHFDTFICYEVEGSVVTITEYMGDAGNERTTTGRLGYVVTPDGVTVKDTSAYGKIRFDIKNIIDESLITKTRDIYCTLEINN